MNQEQSKFIEELDDEGYSQFYAMLLMRLKIHRHAFPEFIVRGILTADEGKVDEVIQEYKKWEKR